MAKILFGDNLNKRLSEAVGMTKVKPRKFRSSFTNTSKPTTYSKTNTDLTNIRRGVKEEDTNISNNKRGRRRLKSI